MIACCRLAAAMLACAAPACADETVLATDTAHVTRLGRPYLTGSAGLGLSWLGSGVRVAHTGRALKATFGVAMVGFKVSFAQSNQGAMHYEGNSWIAATGLSESVVIGSSAGTIDMVLNMPPQYFDAGDANATLLALTSVGGSFLPAPPQPTRIFHVSTIIHSGWSRESPARVHVRRPTKHGLAHNRHAQTRTGGTIQMAARSVQNSGW
jgi:hypothetical protein